MARSFEATVRSMAGMHNSKKDIHPWWAVAAAVVNLIDSGEYPEAVEFMEEVYNEGR